MSDELACIGCLACKVAEVLHQGEPMALRDAVAWERDGQATWDGCTYPDTLAVLLIAARTPLVVLDVLTRMAEFALAHSTVPTWEPGRAAERSTIARYWAWRERGEVLALPELVELPPGSPLLDLVAVGGALDRADARWWPPGDGNFALIAEVLAAGRVDRHRSSDTHPVRLDINARELRAAAARAMRLLHPRAPDLRALVARDD